MSRRERPQRDKNDVRITVRLPAKMLHELEDAADRRDRNPNWLARHILSAWLLKERTRRPRAK